MIAAKLLKVAVGNIITKNRTQYIMVYTFIKNHHAINYSLFFSYADTNGDRCRQFHDIRTLDADNYKND